MTRHSDRREDRRLRAEARAAERARRTVAEQLALIESRPGISARETLRLHEAMKSEYRRSR